MRKEPFTINDFVHVYNRGNRKQPIVRDEGDRWYFVQSFYYFNTKRTPPNPFQALRDTLKSDFNVSLLWPVNWPPQEKIVEVLAFNVLDNHKHLILKETTEGGTTMFMRRIGTGSTNRFNKKYGETGRLFQGAYKAKRVEDDNYLKYLLVYVMVINSFDIYLGGFDAAKKNFDAAYEWAARRPYCSLGNYAGLWRSPVIDKSLAEEFFPTPQDFKEFARDCVENKDLKSDFKGFE